MQSIESRFVCLIVVLLSVHIKIETALALSAQCGEFNGDKYVQGRLAELDRELGFEAELEQFFDAFNENDTERMDEALKLLELVQSDFDDEVPAQASKQIIESVVSACGEAFSIVNLK